jgi:hypothetical protein
MKRALSGRGLRATLTVAALGSATLLVASTAALAGTATSPSQAGGACISKAQTRPHVGRFGGVIGAVSAKAGCQTVNPPALSANGTAGDTANGTPPLIWHGGAVMGTASTGPLVITPIFWNPAGHPMATAYKSLLTQYLSDVASASGQNSNVYSIATEYSGTDGTIRDQIQLGTPINDTGPLPASGCKLLKKDTTGIYADNSGYNACIDDAQVVAETDRVVSANSLPRNFSHIYVLYLPKGVESCFNAGLTSNAKNACTINYEPSAAYCAYHSQAPSGTVYANMPYPVYLSKTGFTCGTDVNFPGVIETPNGNPDADTEISPSSHEINEAWTDPDTSTGWYDSSGFENGDECAYIFGATSGTPGAFYNQKINGHHYLTQEEFSNNSFFQSGGGCLQSKAAEG